MASHNRNYNTSEATDKSNRGAILVEDDKDDNVVCINNALVALDDMIVSTATTTNLEISMRTPPRIVAAPRLTTTTLPTSPMQE